MEFLIVFFGMLAGLGLKDFIESNLISYKKFIIILIFVVLIPNPINWNVFTDPINLSPGEQTYLLQASREIVTETEKILSTKTPLVLATPPIAFIIPTISQWSLYLSPNIHYAGIFSSFDQHLQKILALKYIPPGKLVSSLRDMGIQAIILKKEESAYTFSFHVRSRPLTIWTPDPWPYPYETLSFSPTAFLSSEFIKTFENDKYIVFAISNTSKNSEK
ncbi:MAG: hypothetical protein WHS87_10045 [Anaerolineales bacterium]